MPPTSSDYLNLSQASYTSGSNTAVAPPGSDWTVIKTETFSSGMQGVAFQNTTTGEVVISYEGTNLSNLGLNTPFLAGQVQADMNIAAGTTPQANRSYSRGRQKRRVFVFS